MGSNGEGSQNERNPVTVQIQLKDGSKISIETELDLTVEELKKALVEQTSIPSDEQMLIHTGRKLRNPETLRSYEMDLDKSIRLFRIEPGPASTSIETYEPGPYKIHPRFINQVAIAKLMKNMPILSNLEDFPNCWALWLENPHVLHSFLLVQLTKNVWLESFKDDVTDSINIQYEVPKVACMYYAQSGIPHGTEQIQFQLGLMGFSFVDTSGKGSESSNANRSESAPSYRGASSSQTNQVPGSDDDDDDDEEEELMGLSYWQEVHKISVDILVPIILSDATLSRHCKEQGRSVHRAYASVVETVDRLLLADNMIQDKYDAVLNSLDMELGEYIRPILEKLYPIPYIVDYVWSASNDGSTSVPRNVVVPEEFFALQLAEMEQMGFMDRQENIIALLSSLGDAKKAVKRLNFRKTKSEEGGGSEADPTEGNGSLQNPIF